MITLWFLIGFITSIVWIISVLTVDGYNKYINKYRFRNVYSTADYAITYLIILILGTLCGIITVGTVIYLRYHVYARNQKIK